MEKIWVVAADNVHARLFQAENVTGPLREARDMLNPESRLKERELVTDAKGRTYGERGGDSIGDARRQKFEPPSEKEHQARLFAREVVDEIEKLRERGELERLHVVAEPSFLGRMREFYPAPLHKCVSTEVSRNVTSQPAEDIRELLPYRM